MRAFSDVWIIMQALWRAWHALQFATEGTVLEGGEEDVEFGKRMAVCCFEGINSINLLRKPALQFKRGNKHRQLPKFSESYLSERGPFFL